MAHAVVIFGAAVRPDGQPSPSLRRRVLYGATAARHAPDSLVFCSGGVGRQGPSEASLMARLLGEAGIEADRIVLDEESRDTLQNVVAAARFVRARGLDGVIACTDAYHLPRTRMLFSVLGVPSRAGPAAWRPAGSLTHWAGMHAREAAAFPYDLAVALWRRRELMALTGA